MAQRTKVTMIDDLDGASEAVETVRFSLNNTSYEIDLNGEHTGELRTVLQDYADAGRRMGGTRRSTSARPKAQPTARTSDPTSDEIRAWARDQGLEVSTRGRISTKVRQAYARLSNRLEIANRWVTRPCIAPRRASLCWAGLGHDGLVAALLRCWQAGGKSGDGTTLPGLERSLCLGWVSRCGLLFWAGFGHAPGNLL